MKLRNRISPLFTTYAAIALLLASCEEIVDFKGNIPPDKLVVNSIISATYHTHYNINLSTTSFIFEKPASSDYSPESSLQIPDDYEPDDLENAKVKLTIDDEPVNVVRNGYTSHYFTLPEPVQAGQKFSLSIDAGKLGVIKAEDIMPQPPTIVSVDTVRVYDQEAYMVYMRTLIRIKDNPKEKNYYRLIVKQKNFTQDEHTGSWYDGSATNYYYINQDVVLSSLTNENSLEREEDENKSRIFPDDLFQGQEYTLNIYYPVPFGKYSDRQKLEVDIELQALTESMYLYMRTVELSNNSDTFTNPVRIYSNIQNGQGIMGLYNSTSYSLTIPSAPPKYPWEDPGYW